MTDIKLQELEARIEKTLYARLTKSSYRTYSTASSGLLSSNRLDLCFRVLYLELKDTHPELAEKIYRADLKAHTLGSFNDDIDLSKDSFKIFQEVFHSLFQDLSKNGFDPSKTLIPLAKDGSILNGSHRTASAIVSNKYVSVVETELPPILCDYNFFYERAVPIDVIEQAVLKYLELSENTFLAFLWPSSSSTHKVVEQLFSNIIYKKRISLNCNGALNLLHQCYGHMDWVGSHSTSYDGLYQKLTECYPNMNKPTTLIVFQCDGGLPEVRLLKQKAREISKLGFSSIHITDTKLECLGLSHVLLNKNGLHFLNHAQLVSESTKQKLNLISQKAKTKAVSTKDFVIDGSFLLELYGLRKAADIDIVAFSSSIYTDMQLEPRIKELSHHAQTPTQLIYNPEYYFYYQGLKLVSFDQLYKMKCSRGEPKDLIDTRLMQSIHRPNLGLRSYSQLMQHLLYSYHRAYGVIAPPSISLLKRIRIYKFLKKMLGKSSRDRQ